MTLRDRIRAGYRPTLREKILTAGCLEELEGMKAACEGRDEPLSAAEMNAYSIRKMQLERGK